MTNYISSFNSERSLKNYLNDIRSIPLIEIEDEITLARQIREGDQIAMQKLVRANLRFVITIAKQYQNYGLPLNDLINEGNVGLIQAALRFDETKGNKFISYAVWWIRQCILQAIQDQCRTIRLPQNKIATLVRIQKARNELTQELERTPTNEELASHLEMDIDEISAMDNYALNTVSLDRPINYKDESLLIDIVHDQESDEPDQDINDEEWKNELYSVIDSLSAREAKVLKMYYGIHYLKPHTLDEIAQEFKVTRERIRQIKEKALLKLRYKSRCRHLKYNMD
ncbi:MAG: sigma-70 family RNA polymerase sigma factor [Calditrichaceae bacterium]|nr:sigma-70 family RNA polymerase sigma factor [Calditrichaceae bacterium]MBN2707398.1 sigma-70 family RNA polymerase sigma factor [Calditrichaceae bacterium]RQV93399.1 MAG: RNA polymerase sigma factor RpoD/SigA [Calditrichota bacterium]